MFVFLRALFRSLAHVGSGSAVIIRTLVVLLLGEGKTSPLFSPSHFVVRPSTKSLVSAKAC